MPIKVMIPQTLNSWVIEIIMLLKIMMPIKIISQTQVIKYLGN